MYKGIYVGYRYFDTFCPERVRYPFGFGLSYTMFAVEPLSHSRDAEGITVRVKVTNIGTAAGKEVVQLYIGDDKSSVVRPLKELKHFQKIALNPGEEQTVTFIVSADDLKYYDEATKDWKAEAGKFKAYIGSSSADIRTVVPFVLE